MFVELGVLYFTNYRFLGYQNSSFEVKYLLAEIKTKQNKKQMAKTIKCLTIIITSFHLLHANFALSYQLYTRQRNEVEI